MSQTQTQAEFFPWYGWELIDFVSKYVNENTTVFEYGCGFSTIFYAKRCRFVNAIETRDEWLLRVKNFAKDFGISAKVDVRKCHNLQHFSTEIKSFGQKSYDLIVVDSRDRMKCIEESCNFVSQTGLIVLDNSERPNLFGARNFMESQGFFSVEFSGDGPMKKDTPAKSLVFSRNFQALH